MTIFLVLGIYLLYPVMCAIGKFLYLFLIIIVLSVVNARLPEQKVSSFLQACIYCFRESDDTVLLIMNEILNHGLSPSPSPGPTETMQSAPWSTTNCGPNAQLNSQGPSMFAQPTASFQTIGPPPTHGFVPS